MKTSRKNQQAAGLTRKKEGFQGQKAVSIPRKILLSRCAGNNLIGGMYITDMGYYPKAKFHFRERPHGADQHILIYCTEGRGEVTIRQQTQQIEAGDFFVIPKKTSHTYAADEINPWTIYWIHFKGQRADSLLEFIIQKFSGYKGFKEFAGNTMELFNEMYTQLERGYSIDYLINSNMCLSHYLATFLYTNQANQVGELGYKDISDVAVDFFKSSLDKTLTLHEMASSVNLSASHFSSVFKKKTGFTPIEYFNHLKVQKACQFLLFTELRIKEIALELGIDDPFYFSRMFTKVMGISPNDYREKRIH